MSHVSGNGSEQRGHRIVSEMDTGAAGARSPISFISRRVEAGAI